MPKMTKNVPIAEGAGVRVISPQREHRAMRKDIRVQIYYPPPVRGRKELTCCSDPVPAVQRKQFQALRQLEILRELANVQEAGSLEAGAADAPMQTLRVDQDWYGMFGLESSAAFTLINREKAFDILGVQSATTRNAFVLESDAIKRHFDTTKVILMTLKEFLATVVV
ncbi:hypothetical protein Tdes44962_MAKER03031 [Teratosphaeria destructans]|uniref:Uncharacterized protein n=1 Tax=Teratosphaeria destructans TaxID=418781 RepID=A0A9W7SR36_9PEZI|nr:hypothetical protein Tdes44962_MAKER03031 [Teratosphaeria destructans]